MGQREVRKAKNVSIRRKDPEMENLTVLFGNTHINGESSLHKGSMGHGVLVSHALGSHRGVQETWIIGRCWKEWMCTQITPQIITVLTETIGKRLLGQLDQRQYAGIVRR